MNRKSIAYNFEFNLKMSHCFIVLALSFCVAGCAMLQETPPVEISASRLFCEKNPEIIDGKLDTVSVFEAHGAIRKGFGRGGNSQRQYQHEVIGSLKTETLIKLDAPTYIDYIEVYPASTLPNFILDATVEEKSSKWMLSFEAIEDKRGEDIEGTQPVRFRIRRKVLYVRLTANALTDSENVGVYSETAIKEMETSLKKMNASTDATEKVSRHWRKQRREGEMQIPLKGAAIREIKFFERQ